MPSERATQITRAITPQPFSPPSPAALSSATAQSTPDVSPSQKAVPFLKKLDTLLVSGDYASEIDWCDPQTIFVCYSDILAKAVIPLLLGENSDGSTTIEQFTQLDDKFVAEGFQRCLHPQRTREIDNHAAPIVCYAHYDYNRTFMERRLVSFAGEDYLPRICGTKDAPPFESRPATKRFAKLCNGPDVDALKHTDFMKRLDTFLFSKQSISHIRWSSDGETFSVTLQELSFQAIMRNLTGIPNEDVIAQMSVFTRHLVSNDFAYQVEQPACNNRRTEQQPVQIKVSHSNYNQAVMLLCGLKRHACKIAALPRGSAYTSTMIPAANHVNGPANGLPTNVESFKAPQLPSRIIAKAPPAPIATQPAATSKYSPATDDYAWIAPSPYDPTQYHSDREFHPEAAVFGTATSAFPSIQVGSQISVDFLGTVCAYNSLGESEKAAALALCQFSGIKEVIW